MKNTALYTVHILLPNSQIKDATGLNTGMSMLNVHRFLNGLLCLFVNWGSVSWPCSGRSKTLRWMQQPSAARATAGARELLHGVEAHRAGPQELKGSDLVLKRKHPKRTSTEQTSNKTSKAKRSLGPPNCPAPCLSTGSWQALTTSAARFDMPRVDVNFKEATGDPVVLRCFEYGSSKKTCFYLMIGFEVLGWRI